MKDHTRGVKNEAAKGRSQLRKKKGNKVRCDIFRIGNYCSLDSRPLVEILCCRD
jgi:hypothetical protein